MSKIGDMVIKQAMKSALPYLDDYLPEVDKFVDELFCSYDFKPNESEIIAVIKVIDKKVYILIVSIDEEDTIQRVIERYTLTEFIQKLMKVEKEVEK